MADDNNPFGTPTSLFGSIFLFCLSIGVVGGFFGAEISSQAVRIRLTN
jgi:hypothetical protein